MKRVLTIILVILLSACSSNGTTEYDEVINAHFPQSEYSVNNDTITIILRDDTNYNDMIAKGDLLLDELEGDYTLKIYKYNNVIPTIIILREQDNEVIGTVFNEKE